MMYGTHLQTTKMLQVTILTGLWMGLVTAESRR